MKSVKGQFVKDVHLRGDGRGLPKVDKSGKGGKGIEIYQKLVDIFYGRPPMVIVHCGF